MPNGRDNVDSCKEWNTIVEEIIQKPEKNDWKSPSTSVKRVSKPT